MPRAPRALVLLLGVAVATSPTSIHAANVSPHPQAPLTNQDELPRVASAPVDTNTECGPPSATPVPDGQDIVVTIAPITFTVGKIPSAWWKNPPYGDAGWRLQLWGLMWTQSLAQRAAIDGQTKSLNTLVEQAVAFHAQNPDPNTNDWGWDEGASLRRLGAENCLYSLTRDPRLIPGMQADVAVQYGWRFYGPPYKAGVHNHGVMADLAVLKAADLLGRKDWQDKTIARLEYEAPLAWTALGTSIEQSSSYHVFNVTLWGWVGDALEHHLGFANPSVQKIRALDAKAGRVSAWITEPDRKLVVYGDATADDGFTRSTWVARTFRDDGAGVTVGRWSWNDPATTYYTIRYGPKRWAHGQQDRGGVTWSTLGQRVLVNPGRGSYDPAGNYRAYAGAPNSHNVAYPDRRTLITTAKVWITASNLKAASHGWVTVEALFGIKHTRTISVARDTHSLSIKDVMDGGAPLHQFWHLAPTWQLVAKSADGKSMTFKNGIRTLLVGTTGAATVIRGRTRPVAGWNFPTPSSRVGACEIQVAARGTATTTFRVF